MDLHPTAVKEETGFSVVEMLLCLVIVCLVTFIGLYVYNTQKSANAAYQAANKIAQTSAAKNPRKAPAAPESTADNLTIKEWGVRFKLDSPTIANATYDAPLTVSFAPGTERIAIGSQATDSTVVSCSNGSKQILGKTDYLYRSTDKSKVTLADSSAAKKIGDYYYSIERRGMNVQCNAFPQSTADYSKIGKAYLNNWEADKLVAS